MPLAKVLEVVNPLNLPVYSGPTGSIEGRVFVEGDAAPERPDLDFSKCPEAKEAYSKLFRDEAPAPKASKRPLLDAVVGITGYRNAYIPSRGEAVTVEIQKCGFLARTIVLTLGQRLDVLNRDAISADRFFAPDLVAAPTSVLRIAAPGGDAVKLYPKTLAHELLVDKMNRKHMRADVYVLANPLTTVTTAGGRYRIDGVPVGKMNATVFHPTFVDSSPNRPADAGTNTEASALVTIEAGKVTNYDAVLTFKK
jgi:hypothetical protein